MLLNLYTGSRVGEINSALLRDDRSLAITRLAAATDRVGPMPDQDYQLFAVVTGTTITAIAYGVDREALADREEAASRDAAGPQPGPDIADGRRVSPSQQYYGTEPSIPQYPDGADGICDLRMSLKLLGKALGLPDGVRVTRVDQDEVEQRIGTCSLTVVGPMSGRMPRLGIGCAIPQRNIDTARTLDGSLDPEMHAALYPDRPERSYNVTRGWHYVDEPEERPRDRPVHLT